MSATMVRRAAASGGLLLLLVGAVACSSATGHEPPPAATADEAVTRVTEGLASNQPQVLWYGLPESYQNDVEYLLAEAAGKMDAELWDRSFDVMGKMTRVLKEKKKFILSHPMLAAQMKDREEAEDAWDSVVAIAELLVNSELADLEEVRSLDVGRFLAGTGAELMDRLDAVAAITGDDTMNRAMEKLGATTATVLGSEGDTATVRIEAPDEPPVEQEFVRVEGKWIPKEMQDEWRKGLAEIKEQLDSVSTAELTENKPAMLMQLSMIDGALDQVLATETAEEFNAAIGAAMGTIFGAVMSQAGGGLGAGG